MRFSILLIARHTERVLIAPYFGLSLDTAYFQADAQASQPSETVPDHEVSHDDV